MISLSHCEDHLILLPEVYLLFSPREMP